MRAAPMIRAGYIMLAVYLIIAIIFWIVQDLDHAAMFMAGGMLWVIGIMIWGKVLAQEEEDK